MPTSFQPNSPRISIDKRALKAATDTKTAVPGADLNTSKHQLVRK